MTVNGNKHPASFFTENELARARLHLAQLQIEQQDYARSPRPNLYAWYADLIAEDERRIAQLETFARYEQRGIPAGCLVEVRHHPDDRVQLRGIATGKDRPSGHDHSFVAFKWMPDLEPPDTGWSEARSRREVSVVRHTAWVYGQLGVALVKVILHSRSARDRAFYAALKSERPDVYRNLIAMLDPMRQVGE